MAWTPPTVADFKTYFFRDFNYGSTLETITDADISKAMGQALVNFNTAIGGTDDQLTIMFLFLTAFYMVYDIQTSTQGLGSQSNFPISSKSVGSIAVTFSIPERYAKEPQISFLAQNGYGLKYLSLVWPYTVGNIRIINGTTTIG